MNRNARSGAIRFAILHEGAGLESWQSRCLEHLAPVAEACADLSVDSHSSCLAPDAITRLSDGDLDFILCFADIAVPRRLLDLPRYGIWRFQIGDRTHLRGEPAGFWEVYQNRAVTAARLVRMHADPSGAIVLREGFLRTEPLSVRKNKDQWLTRFTHWPAQVCRDIRVGRTAVFQTSPRKFGAAARSAAAHHRWILSVRILWRMAGVGFRSLFRHDQWNVGIVDQPVEQFLKHTGPVPVRWLPATPRSELRADPFAVIREGRATILCEHFSYRDNRGFIVAIDPDRAESHSKVHIGPEPPVHLSYPFLFEVDGRLFCMPESSEAQEIALYEPARFPDGWTKVATLIAGRGYVDATLFETGGRWWLAASEVIGKGANSELHLWHAAAPVGPWIAHEGNPVKIDVRSARPAGAPFVANGVLYRPAQDCSGTYGARVVINRVLVLTSTEFREEAVATVDPDPNGKYPDGLHTLSTMGDKTLIDGKRAVFAPAEFFRVLAHYLK